MPLKTPSPAKSSGKPAGKVIAPARGKDKAASAPKKKGASLPPPEPTRLRWWDTLTDERKLDVVGAVMAVIGLLTGLVLLSAQKSAVTGSMMRLMSQMFGWGIYVLPVGFVVMGLWLILRRIEKLPPLSLERATGFIFFFLWLLAILHIIIATAAMADRAAFDGAGGGFIGAFFEKALINSFGSGGTVVLLLAWLLLTVTMILDRSVQDLFKWVSPLFAWVRASLARRRVRPTPAFSPETADILR